MQPTMLAAAVGVLDTLPEMEEMGAMGLVFFKEELGGQVEQEVVQGGLEVLGFWLLSQETLVILQVAAEEEKGRQVVHPDPARLAKSS